MDRQLKVHICTELLLFAAIALMEEFSYEDTFDVVRQSINQLSRI